MSNATKIQPMETDFEELDVQEVRPEIVQSKEDLEILQGMLDAGVQFGHKKSKGHPKMAPYVYANRNELQIIDVSKTLAEVRSAVAALKKVIETGGTILFVGTHASAREVVKDIAVSLGMPYVTVRWLGGLLTNFNTIKKRVTYFLDLERKRATGELEKYTKKERLLFDRELAKLENNLGGVKHMDKLPQIVFVVDIKEHDTAVHEANKLRIPVVGICDTDVNPTPVTHVIPANDNSTRAITFLMGMIKKELMGVRKSV